MPVDISSCPATEFVLFEGFGSTTVTLIYDAKTLGARIKLERKSQKISQPEMARRAECARNTIFNIETGENVAVDIIFRVLKELGMGLQISSSAKAHQAE